MICCLQTLHAICDLGTLIAKRLCHEQTNLSEAQMVPLPAQLYTPLQDNQNENSVVCAPTKHERIALVHKASIIDSYLILCRRVMSRCGWEVRKYWPISRL